MTDLNTPTPTSADQTKPCRGRQGRLGRMVAVVLLGGALAAGIGGFAYADRHGGPGGQHGGQSMGSPGMGGMLGGRMMSRMLDEVNATDEQRAKIRDIYRAARNDVEKQTDVIQAQRRAATAELAKPVIDRAGVEAIRATISRATDEVSKRVSLAMIDVAEVLTPEQRVKLAERLATRGGSHR